MGHGTLRATPGMGVWSRSTKSRSLRMSGCTLLLCSRVRRHRSSTLHHKPHPANPHPAQSPTSPTRTHSHCDTLHGVPIQPASLPRQTTRWAADEQRAEKAKKRESHLEASRRNQRPQVQCCGNRKRERKQPTLHETLLRETPLQSAQRRQLPLLPSRESL
jgi:hypothetical protein